MWIGVHEAMYELNPKVTQKIIKNWICARENDENFSVINYILNHVENKPEYYEKLAKTMESEFIADTALLLPKVQI